MEVAPYEADKELRGRIACVMARKIVVNTREANIRVAAVAVAQARYGGRLLSAESVRHAAQELSLRTGHSHAAAMTYSVAEALGLAAKTLRQAGQERLIDAKYR